MAAGYLTHARENQRRVRWLFVSYVIAFQILAAFALTIFLLFLDPLNTILTNPLGYALRYCLPVALLAALMFRLFYHGHIDHVRRKLGIETAFSNLTDPNGRRFLRIAEEQCLALGVRLPRFGIIDAAEPNALAIGATRDDGLIAVTRGLLEKLDDEELAAVIAHEVAHIRNGDTKLLAANHAMMRTAVNFQVNNPFRMENPVQLLLVLALPFFLPILLAGGAATMLAMQMSFQARRGISLARDLIADGDAVRVTLFPEALISALRKVSGQGDFAGSENFRALLFCGGTSAAEGMRATVQDRISAISTLGGAMMRPGRVRRDTRPHVALPKFGQRGAVASVPVRREPLGPPPPAPSLAQMLAHPGTLTTWHNHCVDYWEWKESDKRNALGLTPKMFLPLAAVVTFMLIYLWPSDGNYRGAVQLFNPAALVDMASSTRGTFNSSDPSAANCAAGSVNGQCGAASSGGLAIFPGASEEARKKQGLLTMIIMMLMVFGTAIPGVRERLYPNVDWNGWKVKRPMTIFDVAAPFFKSKGDGYEERVEREFAKLRAAHDRGELGQQFDSPASPQAAAPPPPVEIMPERIIAPRIGGFGRKGL
jgi:heat shock protein HtpX